MKKTSIRGISLRRQLEFGFEKHWVETRDRVVSCATRLAEQSGDAPLEEIVRLGEERFGLKKPEIVQHVFWLAQDSKLEFRAGGKPLTPQRAKKTLLDSASQAVTVIPTRCVDEAVFEHVKRFFQTLTGEVNPGGVEDPYDFSRLLEKRIRRWEIALESFLPAAQQPCFPGEREIQEGLALIKKLSEKRDAFSLITGFYENRDPILKLVADMVKLSDFYSWQRKFWETLIDSMERFSLESEELRQRSEIADSLDRLAHILSSPEPYALVDEARELLRRVGPCHARIVSRKTEEARAAALEKVRHRIDRLAELLDNHQAGADLRNQSLISMRQIEKRILAAETIQAIRTLGEDAEDKFEVFREEIESCGQG